MSHPSRGGWIEISIPRRKTLRNSKSHPSRGGWIEITAALWCNRGHLSHPSRGGWIEIRGNSGAQHRGSSPTPHGVGGLKCDGFRECMRVLSPTPHGVGGLKSPGSFVSGCLIASHPSRGGWIEIRTVLYLTMERRRPTPHGVGGLKSKRNAAKPNDIQSHPSRGGWIEIRSRLPILPFLSSHPSRGGWIEMQYSKEKTGGENTSHPSRGGWIEINHAFVTLSAPTVPPLTGWVD